MRASGFEEGAFIRNWFFGAESLEVQCALFLQQREIAKDILLDFSRHCFRVELL